MSTFQMYRQTKNQALTSKRTSKITILRECDIDESILREYDFIVELAVRRTAIIGHTITFLTTKEQTKDLTD